MRHAIFFALLLCASATSPALAQPEALDFFEKRIRPVLVEKCQSCHGAKVKRGGLRLDSREALLRGGDSGPSIVPGQPDKSVLIKAIRREGDLQMPPKDRPALTQAEIADLAAWVQGGAPWPVEKGPVTGPSTVELARKQHWSFRPVVRPAVPDVRSKTRVSNAIDPFILAKLEAKGLTLSPAAERRTLIRRLSFDLLGLPPTPEEVEAFVADTRPGASERLVERLLASPAYGERWARHWLDVARYADTKGYVFTAERRFPYSYTYRDYVIDAFNADLPYDQFLLHQLAADQLPLGDDPRPLAAMGYLTLGRRFLNNTHDIIDDRIDVVTRGMLGLTVACARCHDHKYDPVSTRDYYSLYGVFASSVEPNDLPLLTPPTQSRDAIAFDTELRKRLAVVDGYLAEQRGILLPKFRARVGDYLLAAREEANSRRSDELSRVLVQRWRARLMQAKTDPLLAPFAGKSPAGLTETVAKYNALFKDVDDEWTRLLALAAEKKQPAPQKLADANREAVRQLLYAPGSPLDIPVTEIEKHFNRAQRDKLTALRKRVDQWRATGPGAPPRAMVLVDAASPTRPRVLVRGNPANPGVEVPRQFLEVLTEGARKPFAKGSGRLELAQAIATKDNPLTARVLVNRLWMHHFGKGLVNTPGNFGLRGEAPTHPELLDWLADEFVRSGWSIKHLHRLILNSATYRQASDERADVAAIDPENTLLWRMNRRRLELEPLRDALLSVSGRLDRRMGGPGVDITVAPYPLRRTVYAFIERQNLPSLFRSFDLASPDSSTSQRHATTVPQQALFLMNGPFVQGLARAFAERTDLDRSADEAQRIDRMHRLAYGRAAEPEEIALGREFIRSAGATRAGGLTAWEQYAQVLLLANELAFVD